MTIIPVLIICELLFFPFLAWKARRDRNINTRQMTATFLPFFGLFLWTIITVILGISGIYDSENFYKLYPALWIPAIPMIVVFASLGIPIVLKGIRSVLDITPAYWLVFFQAGRISAIGTLYHTLQGTFPLYFEIIVGIPDLCFGISALVMGILTMQRKISSQTLIIWHIIGCIIIVPTAPLLLQLGLPGSWQIFVEQPTAQAIYKFPMSLAPTLVVPTFVIFNLLAVWQQQRISKHKS